MKFSQFITKLCSDIDTLTMKETTVVKKVNRSITRKNKFYLFQKTIAKNYKTRFITGFFEKFYEHYITNKNCLKWIYKSECE